MKVEEIEEIKKNLEQELTRRGLRLVWSPRSNDFWEGDLLVFGAEQAVGGKDELLVAGFGPGGFSETHGNSPISAVLDYQGKFLEALESVGIPKNSLHSNYPHVGRGKIWPTFVARLTREVFQSLKSADQVI